MGRTGKVVTVRKQRTFSTSRSLVVVEMSTFFDGDDIHIGMSVFIVEEKGSRGSILHL